MRGLRLLGLVLALCLFVGCNEDVAYVVQKGPAIEANTKFVNFGLVDIGSQFFIEIDISNIGESPLDVTDIVSISPDFVFGAMGATEFNLSANRSQIVQLFFWPLAVQSYTGQIEIYSNAENFPVYTISLAGEGQNWAECGDCANPPDEECLPNGYMLVYEQNGVCENGQCRYDAQVIPCVGECLEGVCVGDGGVVVVPPQTGTTAPLDAGAITSPITEAPDSGVVVEACPAGDTDGDEICDDDDNCVNDPNADQTDSDQDDIGDVCDACPNLPNGQGIDADNNGIDEGCAGDYCFDHMSTWAPLAYPVSEGSLSRTLPVAAATSKWVVDDLRTGLMWIGCEYGSESGTNCNDSVIKTSWLGQWNHCADLDWGGFTDWTIPSIYELRSLVDYHHGNDEVDSTIFPGLDQMLWSSTPHTEYNGNYYTYSAANGRIDTYDDSSSLAVLCVRRPTATQRCFDMIDNSAPDEDVVIDLNSALMWQLTNWSYNASNGWAGDHGYGGNHPGPITTPCNDSYGGYADWRMPSLSEMASLISYSHSSPTWPTEVFEDPLYGQIFWTATRKTSTSSSEADDYWIVDLDWGHIYTQDGPTASAKIKCVRP
jgi:hypothetical protein